MQINEQIIETLSSFNINKSDAICYLISLYHGYQPSYIPDELKRKVNATNIVNADSKGVLQWNVPLFDKQTTAFEWVTKEYQEIFKPYGTHNKNKRECIARMKKFFSLYPEVRKEDVLGATRLYINSCISQGTSTRYVRQPHYFISKDKGSEAISDLRNWLDEWEEQKEIDSNILVSDSRKLK